MDLEEGEGGYIRRFRSMLFMLRFIIIKVTRFRETFGRIGQIGSFRFGDVFNFHVSRCYYNLLYLVIEGGGLVHFR